MLDRGLAQHEQIATQDVVDVGALLRQQVDALEVGGGQANNYQKMTAQYTWTIPRRLGFLEIKQTLNI